MLIEFLESKGICSKKEYEDFLDAMELAGHMANDDNRFKSDIIILNNYSKVVTASRKLRLGNHILALNGMVLSSGNNEDYYWDGNKIIFTDYPCIGDKIVIYWLY